MPCRPSTMVVVALTTGLLEPDDVEPKATDDPEEAGGGSVEVGVGAGVPGAGAGAGQSSGSIASLFSRSFGGDDREGELGTGDGGDGVPYGQHTRGRGAGGGGVPRVSSGGGGFSNTKTSSGLRMGTSGGGGGGASGGTVDTLSDDEDELDINDIGPPP